MVQMYSQLPLDQLENENIGEYFMNAISKQLFCNLRTEDLNLHTHFPFTNVLSTITRRVRKQLSIFH